MEGIVEKQYREERQGKRALKKGVRGSTRMWGGSTQWRDSKGRRRGGMRMTGRKKEAFMRSREGGRNNRRRAVARNPKR